MIDPGDQLIYPYVIASRSFFTDNNRYLFNFNDFDHTLEKIDLDKLELVDKYPFEKEGPNGTGEYVDYLVSVDPEKLLIQTSSQAGIFNLEGKKIRDFDLLLEGTSLMDFDRKVFQPFMTQKELIFGQVSNNSSNTYEVGFYDRTLEEFSTIPLAEAFRHGDFNLVHINGNSRRSYAPYVTMQPHFSQNKMVFGSSVSSTLYFFDPQTRQLAKKECNVSLTANEKKGVYRLETEDETVFQRSYVALWEEVTFGPILWDAETERYFRFYYELSYVGEHPSGRFPKPVSTSVYLMILDKELNLFNEFSIPQLTNLPYFSFAKDGKIWIFENIEDELGFVRMSFEL